MVEGDRRPNPLIDKITQQRREQEAQKQSEARALQMLPDFKAQLGGLITAKVPAPEVITQIVTRNMFDNMFDRDYDYYGFGIRELKTKLTAAIPLEDGATASVTISASEYPEADNPDSAKDLDYQVDVADLDRILNH